MRAGELRHRVQLFTHSDVGADGYQSPRYTRQPSGGSHHAKKVLTTAIEQQAGGQMQQVIRATWVFRVSTANSLSTDGLIRHGSEWWSITGLRLHYDEGRYDRGAISVESVQVSDEPSPEDVVE